MAYKLINMWTPTSMFRYKSPYKMKPETLTIHNTGNVASARNEAIYMNRNTNSTSYHVVGDENEIVQLIPFNRNAWAAGDGANGEGNRKSIHFEIARSMDNGYSGKMSERYLQAQENAALYSAYVLKQYNWGVNRLRQHFDWSGKDCPHKMRAHGYWEWFKERVQFHLDTINGEDIKPTETAPKQSSKKTPYTVGEWKTNKFGTQYIEAHGTYTVVGEPVMSRFYSPFDVPENEGGYAADGWSTKYHEMVRVTWDYNAGIGYIMFGYYYNGKLKYIPYRTWNPKTGAVGDEWGKIS